MNASYRMAAAKMAERLGDFRPEIGMILGSGMGELAESVEEAILIPYAEVPGFPVSTVKGHAGRWVAGTLEGRRVLVMQGRFHYYEGHSASTLGLPVRVMKELGAHSLIVTNAAGAVNTAFSPGELMLITDHLNLSFNNPLIGPNQPSLGPRFPDASQAWDPRMQDLARESAEEIGLNLREGVYQFMTGPSYETPAEVRMAQHLGADAVGMSTVPEALAAVHAGIKTLGISYISNQAAGLGHEALSHEEVIRNMEMVREPFIRLIQHILRKI